MNKESPIHWSGFEWSALVKWYEENGRHTLPWRNHFQSNGKSLHQIAYEVWVAEVMLQQTQVNRVIDYYKRFLERFPTIHDLAGVDFDTFFPYYEGLGYYNRARNMLKCAQHVHAHNGEFPNTQEELIKIPGIGPYTAHAIRAFAFNQKTLAFDANLERIFSRYFTGTKRKLTQEEQQCIQVDFEKTSYSGRDMNSALMDFGSTYAKQFKDEYAWKAYPLRKCAWGRDKGVGEKVSLKKKRTGVRRQASGSQQLILVFLHENHKIYYSREKDTYLPFILPVSKEDDRHYIQGYFETTYGLKVSVRPSFGTFELTDEGATLVGEKYTHAKCFHAQIQTGSHDFTSCLPKEKNNFTKRTLKKEKNS